VASARIGKGMRGRPGRSSAGSGFDVTVGTEVEIPAGTYTLAEVFALSSGAGSAGAWKRFRPASGASVVIKGGGTWDVEYTYIDGSTGASSQLLFDGRLHPSYPTSSAFVVISASHVRLSHAEYRGSQDVYAYYDLYYAPGSDEYFDYTDAALNVNRGAAFLCTGTDVEIQYCDFHGNYSFFGDSSATGQVTFRSCFIRNFFNFGSSAGTSAEVRLIGCVLGPAPNHGTNFASASGGYFHMENCLYFLSQEGPTMNDSSTPGTDGVDTLYLVHNTFWQPETTWTPGGGAAYGMDGIGLIGGTASDGVRSSGTIKDNVIKFGYEDAKKRQIACYTAQVGGVLTAASVNYNYYVTAHATPFRTFSGYGPTGESTKTFAQWQTDTGLDADSLYSSNPADLVFVNAPSFTDPQPNPGSAANYWGFPIFNVAGATISEKLSAVRARMMLDSTSTGYNAASDGRSMGIY
jgi:hypothetical protein